MTSDTEHYRYAAQRGVKITSSRFELILKPGEDFYVIKTPRSIYVVEDPAKRSPKFKLTEAQYEKLISRSKKLRVGKNDTPIRIQGSRTEPPLKKPNDADVIARINSGESIAPSAFLLQKPKPYFTKKQLEKFFNENKSRIQAGFKKNLARILEGRPDNSAEHIKVTSEPHMVRVGSAVTLPGDRYVDLDYRALISPDGYFVLTASVSIDIKLPKPELAFRTDVVKDFFKAFVSMKRSLAKSFDLPLGSTVGPMLMKSNVYTQHLAWTRYLLTRI